MATRRRRGRRKAATSSAVTGRVRVPVPRYPSQIEATYVERLVAHVDRLYAQLGEAVATYATALDAREDNVRSKPHNPWQLIEGPLRMRFGDVVVDPRPVGGQISLFNNGQHRRVMNVVPGVNPLSSEPWLAPVMEAWARVNTNLITTLPARALDDIERAVTDAWNRGESTAKLRQRIEQRHGVTQRQAERIARDQVGKLNGQLTAMRQAASGVERYTWRTSRDARVRQRHAEREGVVFKWIEPPPDGHPGMPIQCRCTAEPVIDDLLSTESLERIGSEEHARDVRWAMLDAVDGLANYGDRSIMSEEDISAVKSLLPTEDETMAALGAGRSVRRSTVARRPARRAARPGRPGRSSGPTPAIQSPAQTPQVATPTPVPTFSTVTEAREWLWQTHGFRYSDPRHDSPLIARSPRELDFIADNFRKTGPDRGRLSFVQAVADEVDRLAGLGVRVQGVSLIDGVPLAKRSRADGFAHVGRKGGGVMYARHNPTFDPLYRSKLGQGFTSYWHSAGAEQQIKHTIRHELAHVLTDHSVVSSFPRSTSWALQNLSEYGGANAYESIAESFAWYTAPNYTPGALPADVEAFCERLKKG